MASSNQREDPYYSVRDDVVESLDKVEALLNKYTDRKDNSASDKELADISKELRNSIRSIEWDLEDLQETVSIVEKTPAKFNLTPMEVTKRREFITQVRRRLTALKHSSDNRHGGMNAHKKTEKQSLLSSNGQTTGYTSTTNNKPSSASDSNRQYIEETKQQQQLLIKSQDEQIDNIGASVKVLKNISSQIGTELEEQSVLLDDFGHEMDNTGSKMDSTMKKIAKVTRMSNDRRQWCAIGVLVIIVIILIILIIAV